MLIHKGKILEIVVRKHAKNITDIAHKLDYSRSTIYDHFRESELPDHIIRRYAEALNYNFKDEFPDLYAKWVLEEPPTDYVLNKSAQMLQFERDKYLDLYLKTLEEKAQVALQLADCRRMLATNVSQ